MTDIRVNEFWEAQADEHSDAPEATSPDVHYRHLEITRLAEIMETDPSFTSVLDVGCGNGYSTIEYAKKFPMVDFIGVDLSEKMIEEAKKAADTQSIPNVTFYVGDVQSLSKHNNISTGAFDVVLSTRCLINLPGWREQRMAILEMRKMASAKGRIILAENTKGGLENLNVLRRSQGLPDIKERWHNSYLPDEELAVFLKGMGNKLFNVEYAENIGNTYYLLSRVVYAKMAQMEGKEPDYNHPINQIASTLPTFGDVHACSPNYVFVLRNVGAVWANNQKLS